MDNFFDNGFIKVFFILIVSIWKEMGLKFLFHFLEWHGDQDQCWETMNGEMTMIGKKI